MRIAVYGVGGAGGYFGAQLIRGGQPVAFIARGDHLAAIRDGGLRLATDQGEWVARPECATDDPSEVGPVDVILLGVKTHQVADVAGSLAPMLGEQTFVVPLQNGVETADILGGAIGRERVVGGLCATVSWVSGPGRITSLGTTNFIRFGELDNRPSERTRALCRVFLEAGVDAEIPDDIHVALWEKFLFVVSVGGVAAFHEKTVGEIRSDPASRSMLEQAMQEIHALARARGVPLADDLVERTMGFVDRIAPGGTASMQRDIAEGKASELDAWNGAVVRLAAASGVDTPVHRRICDTLRARIANEATAG